MNQGALARIGSLWIGGPLSWLEVASMVSFVRLGHDYALYTYGDIPNVPEGVDLRDAREVWNTEDIAIYKSAGSPALHADIFRVMMARQTGRVWVDTDIIALRPFPAALGWYIGHERQDRVELGNAVFGTPEGSALMEGLHAFLTDPQPVPPWLKPKHRDQMRAEWAQKPDLSIGDMAWGTFGPKALTHYAETTGEIAHAQPQTAFFPVAFQDRKQLTDGREAEALAALMEREGSFCVHLYSRWLRKVCDRSDSGLPDRNSWVGRWGVEHGVIGYPEAPAPRKKDKKKAPEAGGDQPEPSAKEKRIAERAERERKRQEAAAEAQRFMEDLERRKARIPGGANQSRHGRVSIVTMAKDEGPYVLEWVAHHHVLGFTDILAYTNDCTDGTDEMFDALAAHGLLTRCDNGPWRDKPPQSRALHWAERNPLVTASDWLLVMDLDEFVAIRDGKVDDLLDMVTARGASGICLTWRFFGSNGLTRFESGPVTERMTRAAPDHFVKGYGIKTLFRRDENLVLAIHRPYLDARFARSEEGQARRVDWVNGSGAPIDGKDLKWRLNIKQVGYDLAQMNHYGVKSREEYMLRRLRGDVLDNHSKYGTEYFGVFDRNEVEDRAALSLQAERDALVAKLLTLPEVRAAADLVEARRIAKLERLRATPDFEPEMAQLEPYPLETALKVKRN